MAAGDGESELVFQRRQARVRVIDQYRADIDARPDIAHNAEHRQAVDHLVDVRDEDDFA